VYFRHLYELISMSREWENPHRLPLESYLAGKKRKRVLKTGCLGFEYGVMMMAPLSTTLFCNVLIRTLLKMGLRTGGCFGFGLKITNLRST